MDIDISVKILCGEKIVDVLKLKEDTGYSPKRYHNSVRYL
jgi:hypothetical protein